MVRGYYFSCFIHNIMIMSILYKSLLYNMNGLFNFDISLYCFSMLPLPLAQHICERILKSRYTRLRRKNKVSLQKIR